MGRLIASTESAPSELTRVKRLLVFLPTPLGDAVMATPALRALRNALPEATILWSGARAPLAALAGLKHRDGVVSMAGRLVSGIRSPWRAKKVLRHLDCDAALLLPNSARSALAARVAGIAIRVGTGIQKRAALMTHVIDVPLDERGALKPRSMVSHYADLVRPFGATTEGAPLLVTEPYDCERADIRLAHVPSDRPLVAVNAGAAFGASKVLAPDRIASFLNRLAASVDVTPLLLCGPTETSICKSIADRLSGSRVSTHESPPDIGELKGLLARSALMATTDAGPRHIAEALGVPTLVWMGPTDPAWSEHSTATVIRNESLECLGCHRRTCPIEEPLPHPCMNKLPIDTLVDRAVSLLR